MKLISVIIPTYNSSNTISNALESILKQTFDDYEIIIADGLSSDGTIQKISNLNNSKIKIFSEPDNGIYDAMNKAIYHANGEWLYFLGSDDKLYNNAVLENISELLFSTTSKAVYGNVILKGDSDWAKDKQIYDGMFNIQKILKKNIAHQAVFYHKSLFKIIGRFNLKYKICADYDFNMKMIANYNVQHTDTIIAEFTAGGVSTNNYDAAFVEDYSANVINYFYHHLHKNLFFIFRHDIFRTGVQFLKKGKFKGLKLLFIAGKFHLRHLFNSFFSCIAFTKSNKLKT